MQGLMPNYVKVVPSIAIAFVSYEQVLFLLDLGCLLLFLLLSSCCFACFSHGHFPASSFLRCSKQLILQAACCTVLPMPFVAHMGNTVQCNSKMLSSFTTSNMLHAV